MSHTLTPSTNLRLADSFVGFGGVTLRVALRGWDAGTPEEDVLSGAAAPTSYTGTQDGLGVRSGWHREEPSGEEVYYERYEVQAGRVRRVAHGWIDPVSRQLLQAG